MFYYKHLKYHGGLCNLKTATKFHKRNCKASIIYRKLCVSISESNKVSDSRKTIAMLGCQRELVYKLTNQRQEDYHHEDSRASKFPP